MGLFDFLWGSNKKREPQDGSPGYVPVVSDDTDSNGSDGGVDAGSGGGDGGGAAGGGDGGGAV